MIRYALYKGWHPPYSNKRKPIKTTEEYSLPKLKDRSRNKYRCEHCKGIFRATEIKRDHIKPIISVDEAENSTDDILKRAFCDEKGLALLCKSCHDSKSYLENRLREENVNTSK
jgi:hypothetical protein